MPVMTQIADASEKIFDVAAKTNARAHQATIDLVDRISDVDVPFADRFNKMEIPFADRMPSVSPVLDRIPEPKSAVDTYFEFVASGIATNRTYTNKFMNRFSEVAPTDSVDLPTQVQSTTAKKATAGKSTAAKKAAATRAKNSTPKKAAPKKTAAKKTAAKSTAKKTTAKKTTAKK